MANQDHVINLSEVPTVQINAPEGSAFGGSRQRVGAAIGAQKLGYSFFSVPSGKAAFPYHTHTTNRRDRLVNVALLVSSACVCSCVVLLCCNLVARSLGMGPD